MQHGNQYWPQRWKLLLPTNYKHWSKVYPTNNGPKSTVIESKESLGLGTARELKQFLDESRKIMETRFVVECVENENESPTRRYGFLMQKHQQPSSVQLKKKEIINKPRH
jgi:hypothetical protein